MEMDAAQILRQAREREGLSQERLAHRAGTTQAVISRIEREEMTPTVKMLERLLLALGYELNGEARELEGGHDPVHLAGDVQLSVVQRLRKGFAWIGFAHKLREAGERATGG